MRKCLFFVIMFLFLLSKPVFSQNLSGETEIGTDGKGEGFFSQYLFYDLKNINILTRYFYVNKILRKGEFAIGPILKFSNNHVIKFQFGGTTDKEVMVAGLLIAKFRKQEILHIVDGKLSTQGGPYTLYQKLFITLAKNGTLQFRFEDLQVGSDQSFLRIGLEYRYNLPDSTHVFIAPNYDPIRKGVGGQFGLRFF